MSMLLRSRTLASRRLAPCPPLARCFEHYSCDDFQDRRRRPQHRAPREFSGMELVFLGTSAGGPTLARSASAVALRLGAHAKRGSTWLFDCGEGTYRQLLATPVSHAAVDRIFVSHLHGDHLWGLPGVVVSALLEQRGRHHLHVYGPEGLHEYLSTTLSISRFAPPKSGSRCIVTELPSTLRRPPPRPLKPRSHPAVEYRAAEHFDGES